jgi:hypothetical protein
LKLADRRKNRNRSGYKDINVAVLKKNKDKAGVKKALKSTIEYLVKQEKELKKGDVLSQRDNLCLQTA